MSVPFELARWRPAALLPTREARDPALVFAIAVLCFVACLTALGVIAADRAARGWSGQLTGEATVIIRPRGVETPDAASARAAEVLAGAPGVVEARALDAEQAYELVRPWLGDVADLSDLPVPRLVAVTLDRKRPATAIGLSRVLAAQGIDAVVDDHSVWMADIRRSAGLVRWTGLSIFALIAAAAAALVAFATRAGLSARRDVVEVLHLSGAEAGFISRLFESRFAQVAALGGAMGAAAAAAFGGALRFAGGGEGLTPALPIAYVDLLAVLPCPALAALAAAVAARMTATALIRDMQ
jgi:cell division transport system permease protein